MSLAGGRVANMLTFVGAGAGFGHACEPRQRGADSPFPAWLGWVVVSADVLSLLGYLWLKDIPPLCATCCSRWSAWSFPDGLASAACTTHLHQRARPTSG